MLRNIIINAATDHSSMAFEGGPTMNTQLFRKGDRDFEEFLQLIKDGQKADLIDGVIYMASPDNTDANRLNVWLAAILEFFIEDRELGDLFTSRVAYRITSEHGPEPDLGFLPKELATNRRRGFVVGPPALAIEIVSPDSVSRDYILKRALYEKHGVKEYWIIDLDERRATFLCLRNGKFEEISVVDSIFHSEVLPGFWLDIRWLWSNPRPKAAAVVRKLLQETTPPPDLIPKAKAKQRKKDE